MNTTTINKNRKMNIKKLVMIFMIAVLPLSGFSQSIFDKFEDMEDVSLVKVNKSTFALLGKVSADPDDPEAKEYLDLVKSLNNLRVLATESATIAAEMKSNVDQYLKSTKLTELMRVKDKEGNVKIYIKEGRDSDHVSELFMFVEGISKHMGGEERKPEAVIVSITGDIDLNKISKLTKEMNIQGGEHLKKVKKKD